MLRTPTLLFLAATAAAQPNPFSWPAVKLPDGGRLEFRSQFPRGFDRATPCPVAFVFVDGKQDRGAVWDTQAHRFWMQAPREKFAVILPVAPAAGRFHEGGAASLAPLLVNLRSGMVVAGNGMHAVGIGAGVASALAVARRWPHEFQSLTLMQPGDLPAEIPPADDLPDAARHLRIRVHGAGAAPPDALGKRIARWKGRGFDVAWTDTTKLDSAAKLDNAAMWETLRGLAAARAAPAEEAPLHAVLDRMHAAAARADGATYWKCWEPDGVFLAPDGRWPLDEFRRRAAPHLEKRPGWILVPASRAFRIAADGKTAWVDEELGGVRLGHCRGTGLLVQSGEGWRVARYALSGPPPGAMLPVR